ncbi:hypothetical protein H0261_02160 [Pectobacterium versatile]|uniref:hypothetical protein n=1 Tax=Pectobacterium TaxID=122277 RepID=UPI000E244C84|nr:MULTISPECIES: hypothetical protein [Pectobacterium]MBA0182535.1 hypothetical protein [Pectobacterium versatile]RRO01944.1 hypothetical protein DMB83_011965 [Pectobacterium aquaticum]
MRAFSDIEKTLVRKMIELDDKSGSLNVLGNIINPLGGHTGFPEHCYIELTSENDVSIQVKNHALEQNGIDWIKSIDNDISKKLLTVVALFQYLEDEKLAYFVGDLDFKSLGEKWVDVEYTRCEFLDDDLKPLIFKYSRKKIFVSETLRLLEDNDFKTDEELRHEAEIASMGKQLKFTQLALGVTTIGLIASIMIPILTTSSVEVKNIELVNSRPTLTAIENQLQRMNENDNSRNTVIARIESAILSLQESIDRMSNILSESHNNKTQPTANGDD